MGLKNTLLHCLFKNDVGKKMKKMQKKILVALVFFSFKCVKEHNELQKSSENLLKGEKNVLICNSITNKHVATTRLQVEQEYTLHLETFLILMTIRT